MKELLALRWDRDRDLSGDIVPEAYFRCVALRELEFPWTDAAFERQATEIRFAWTGKFLYVHLWMKDSWVMAEDSVTLTLQPLSEGPAHVWTVFSTGQMTTSLDAKSGGSAWRSGAAFRVRRHDAGWVAEGKIPFQKDFELTPRSGDCWNVLIERSDVDRRGRVSRSTFESGSYGRLSFG